MKVCSIDGCDGAVRARGWCTRHYCRWRKHGDPLVGGIAVPDLLAEVKRLRNALADACIDQYMKDHGYTHIGKPPGTAGQETP